MEVQRQPSPQRRLRRQRRRSTTQASASEAPTGTVAKVEQPTSKNQIKEDDTLRRQTGNRQTPKPDQHHSPKPTTTTNPSTVHSTPPPPAKHGTNNDQKKKKKQKQKKKSESKTLVDSNTIETSKPRTTKDETKSLLGSESRPKPKTKQEKTTTTSKSKTSKKTKKSKKSSQEMAPPQQQEEENETKPTAFFMSWTLNRKRRTGSKSPKRTIQSSSNAKSNPPLPSTNTTKGRQRAVIDEHDKNSPSPLAALDETLTSEDSITTESHASLEEDNESALPTMTIAKQRHGQDHHVTFTTQTIYYHTTILGDSPSVSSGPPLALGQDCLDEETTPVVLENDEKDDNDENDNHVTQKTPPRPAAQLRISPSERHRILWNAGVPEADIQRCILFQRLQVRQQQLERNYII